MILATSVQKTVVYWFVHQMSVQLKPSEGALIMYATRPLSPTFGAEVLDFQLSGTPEGDDIALQVKTATNQSTDHPFTETRIAQNH